MSIKASELRIGNLFYPTVNTLYANPSIHVSITEIRKEFVSFEWDGTTVKMLFSLIKPIPLTEEWLMRAGCDKHSTNEYHILDRVIIYTEEGFVDYATRTKLPHVHSFQNFIHAVRGEELQFKEL